MTDAAPRTTEQTTELESLRQVHRSLVEAVKVSLSSVAAQRAQRRYWLEEICANLDGDGRHQASSVWKRPSTTKKQVSKRSVSKSTTAKRKRTSTPGVAKPVKKPRKKKSLDGGTKKTAKPENPVQASITKTSATETPDTDVRSVGDAGRSTGITDTQRSESLTAEATTGPEPTTSQWGPGAQNLQMMVRVKGIETLNCSNNQLTCKDSSLSFQLQAAVAFGANPASLRHQMMHPPHQQHYNRYFPPTDSVHQHSAVSSGPTPGHYRPFGGSRTYASLEDVANSDDDSDQDKF